MLHQPWAILTPRSPRTQGCHVERRLFHQSDGPGGEKPESVARPKCGRDGDCPGLSRIVRDGSGRDRRKTAAGVVLEVLYSRPTSANSFLCVGMRKSYRSIHRCAIGLLSRGGTVMETKRERWRENQSTNQQYAVYCCNRTNSQTGELCRRGEQASSRVLGLVLVWCWSGVGCGTKSRMRAELGCKATLIHGNIMYTLTEL